MCSVQQKTSKNNFNVAAEAGGFTLRSGVHLAIILYIYIYQMGVSYYNTKSAGKCGHW